MIFISNIQEQKLFSKSGYLQVPLDPAKKMPKIREKNKGAWHCDYSIELTLSIYLFLCQWGHPRTQHFRPAALTYNRLAILPIVRNQIGSIRCFFGLVIILHLKFCQKTTSYILYASNKANIVKKTISHPSAHSMGKNEEPSQPLLCRTQWNVIEHFTVNAFLKKIDLKYLSTAKEGTSWNDNIHYLKTIISRIHANKEFTKWQNYIWRHYTSVTKCVVNRVSKANKTYLDVGLNPT